jgi:hypothetical protein
MINTIARFISSLVILLSVSFFAVHAQNRERAERTYFDNITLDPDGHICYTESLDGTDMNRIEYREEGRGRVSIYETSGELAKYVETTDFDGDNKPDIITVEWTAGGTDVTRLILFRGAEYREHLKRHLLHALRTSTHSHFLGRPEEQERSKEIRTRLEDLDKAEVSDGDIGIYTTDHAFQANNHKDLKYAFAASDNLNGALANIVGGDYKVLSQRTQLTNEFKLDIGILLSINPAAHLPVD